MMIDKQITDGQVFGVCKPGSAECCSYLVAGPDGWECGKATPSVYAALTARRLAKTMNALGDNCSGPPDFSQEYA